MIGDIRYPDGRDYGCDDCKREVKRFKNKDKALAAGWAVARWEKEGRKCYCPRCAPAHRNTGRAGAPVAPLPQPEWVPAGCEQIAIKMK